MKICNDIIRNFYGIEKPNVGLSETTEMESLGMDAASPEKQHWPRVNQY